MYPSLLNPTSISALWRQVDKSSAVFCEHLKIACKCNAKCTQIRHLAKYLGFHEVSGSGSVRSELTRKPVDKWGYNRIGSGNYHYGYDKRDPSKEYD